MELKSLLKPLGLIFYKDWKLIVILSSIFAIYFYYTATFNFFKKKGIPHMKPVIFLGNSGPLIRASKSFHDFQLEIYNRFKGNLFGGIFEGRRPVLYLIDADLIKSVTIRDFDHFTDRRVIDVAERRYLRQTLLKLKGEEWKGVRAAVTPVFSSARLKNMLPLLELCSNQMVTYFKQYENSDVEMKEAMGHYTLEVIGACAFGIKCDAFSKEESHFIKVARKFDDIPRLKSAFILMFLTLAPNLIKFLRISIFNMESTDELVRILQTVKAERQTEDEKNKKKDFLQLLVDVAQKENSDGNETGKKYMDSATIDGQCLLFLIAGYETSSTLLSFAIHVLATSPELQDKLRAHVKQHTEGKDMSYELLSELTYLDAFLHETLRMYPPVSSVYRVVTKPYNLPGTNVSLTTGDLVAIPIYGIHMDPEYYPEPQNFRPERFLGDEKKNRPSHLFLAFGTGPRNCIGLRFAMITAKMAMVSLIQNFKFTKCAKTREPVDFDKRSVLLKTGSGLWVRIEKL